MGLCLMACATCFLREPRTTSPGIGPPTMGRVFPYQSLVKKMLHRPSCSHFMGAFSPLEMTLILYQLDIKLASIILKIETWVVTLA